MMTSLSSAYSPHPGGIHPGVPQGHPMAVPHNPGQQQPGMPQQMHMGVSGPGGPQVSQAGALMGGMPPGAGVPSAHALQHLNPNAAAQQHQMLQQQQQMAFANNSNFQMQQQQQQMIQQQRAQQAARQQMLAQHYSGIPMPMPNGMNQMTQAQFQAMRGAGPTMARPVNLPQHLQQQQAGLQAQHTLEQQQQQQAQAQHQHQQLVAQQMAIQQQANAQAHAGNGQGQQNQLSSQHIQSMQQAQMAQAQAQAQQAQHQQSAAAAAQQNQPPPSQPQPQPQPNPQAQPPVSSQQPQPQAPNNAQQQQAMAAARMAQIQQAQQGEKLRGQCLMKLMLFADHLSNFATNSKPLETYMANGAASRAAAQLTKQQEDLGYWMHFVSQFFSPKGVMRHSLWMLDENSNKQYEIPFSALPRYFHTHFESGVKSMQLITEKGTERALPNSGHYIESQKSTFVYWFDNGSQLVATGSLRAHFDSEHKIELLEFVTNNHEEYLPRAKAIEAFKPVHEWAKEWHKLNTAPEGKQSPELNKKKPKPMRSPPNPPPEIDIAHSKVKPNIGITTSVFRFFELAEVMGQMNLLFHYSHQHSSLTPSALLEQYVTTIVNTANGPAQQNPSGPRTPAMGGFPVASPAPPHIQLPGGSPHITGSPAQAPHMQLQQSQHGTNSSGPSANTSPNASNKRRRPSAVKTEEDTQINGGPKSTVRPSPRLTKKQKPNGPGPG